jgi:hypothetical protein
VRCSRIAAVSVCLLSLTIAATGGDAAQLCLDPEPRTGSNQSYDCSGHPFPHDYIGYDSDGGVPCNTRLDVADECDLGIGLRDDDPPLYYGYSISRSASDPFVNTGPLGETATLYLWYVCTKEDGLSLAELSLSGSLIIVSFTPLNGFLNLGSATDLVLVGSGCPAGPVVAGEIVVRSGGTPVRTSPWGRVKSLYR